MTFVYMIRTRNDGYLEKIFLDKDEFLKKVDEESYNTQHRGIFYVLIYKISNIRTGFTIQDYLEDGIKPIYEKIIHYIQIYEGHKGEWISTYTNKDYNTIREAINGEKVSNWLKIDLKRLEKS